MIFVKSINRYLSRRHCSPFSAGLLAALALLLATVGAQQIGDTTPQPSANPPAQPQTATPPAPAQQGGPYTFRVTAKEVMLNATVLDEKDRNVLGLSKDDFSIFENNVPQTIRFFSQEDAPVSVGILIDNSGSMREKRPEVNRAAINFVKASNPGDEVCIVNFNDEYYLDADFTSDLTKLQEGLDRIESRGGTALYDALIASLDHLTRSAHKDKKVLLIVTDGADNSSRYTLEQTVRLAQGEKGPLIYCIGILNQDDSRSERRHAEKALKELANATGGVAYFPKDLSQVDFITRQVAKDIREQYTMTYHSNLNTPGFRAIRVDVHAPHMKHLTVRTRTGYYAGEQSQSVASAAAK